MKSNNWLRGSLSITILVSLVMLACGGCGSDKGNSWDTLPTPSATYDNSYNGVYKGVLTGSTGHFRISIRNDDQNKITLDVTFDNVTISIDGTESMNGPNYVYTFSQNGYVMTFEVTSSGDVVSGSFTAPNHTGTIAVSVDKATSTTDVSCWEGTWLADGHDDHGTLNMILVGSNFIGSSIDSKGTDQGTYTGSVSGSTISGYRIGAQTTCQGTINGSTASGTWTDSYWNMSGTWSGRRTL
jgi:hypothetical protein